MPVPLRPTRHALSPCSIFRSTPSSRSASPKPKLMPRILTNAIVISHEVSRRIAAFGEKSQRITRRCAGVESFTTETRRLGGEGRLNESEESFAFIHIRPTLWGEEFAEMERLLRVIMLQADPPRRKRMREAFKECEQPTAEGGFFVGLENCSAPNSMWILLLFIIPEETENIATI